MPKYEIMMLVDGSINEIDARVHVEPLLSLFDKLQDYELKIIWNDKLAYEIKKKKETHRFIFNFFLENTEIVKEFNKKAAINKFILRSLVINLEKDYGYKARNNPKKLKISENKQQKYQKYLQYKASKTEKQNFNN